MTLASFARRAASTATAAAPSKVLVVGAGAIGLRTALEFCLQKVPVVVRAPEHPRHSCSAGAGGFWMPFKCDDPRIDQWALTTLDDLLDLAASDSKNKNKELVEILPAIALYRENSGPSVESMTTNEYFKFAHFPDWTKDPRIEFQHLTVEMLSWQNSAYRLKIPPLSELKNAGYLYAWMFKSPICNAPNMLDYYINEISETHKMDLDVETNEPYESLEHMQESARSLGCDLIVNCTGMGARELVNDTELVPGRGAVLQFDRKTSERRVPVIMETESGAPNLHDAVITCSFEPWGSATHPAYLIPRGDKIVVGGTVLEGDEEPNIRPEEREKLFQNAEWLGIDVQNSPPPVGEWVGFRPVRPLIKCEFDDTNDTSIPIFHNYGHGGSGWTVHVGAAKECVNQVLGKKS
mmetsp:Transcript_12329/g.16146  ORF Transcript_12329/g.16146 Transcript_12329/m.16146 type:complete len:408 (+) Transcript_12329:122-1345(+)